MFKYYLQQFFFQILIAAAAVLMVGLFFYAKAVDNNNPPPADAKTLFKNSLGKPKPLSDAEIGEADLAVQHMSSQEVGNLLEIIIAECLSFNPSDFDKNSRLVQSYFTAQGYEQYKAYLQKTDFGNVIKSRNLQSGAFAERPPLEVNSLVQNGVYKWLFEVPVTLSFIPVNSQTYRDGATKAQNQRFTLRVQLTRVKDAKNANKISIEIWQIMPPRR